MLASVPITEELRMLRIATEERTLQYALFLEKTALSIKVDRGFARSVAPEVISIAFRNRGPVTNANDVRALGEFIPYRDGVSWGYGSCLRIETLDDAAECWIIDTRYGNVSTIVASQLPVEKWYGMIGEATFAEAILDRLIHRAVRVWKTSYRH